MDAQVDLFLSYGHHVARFRSYVEHMRPRAMPLAMMTMKNQIHGFPISVHA